MDGREKRGALSPFLVGFTNCQRTWLVEPLSKLYFNRFNNIASFVLRLALLYHFCRLIFANGSEGEFITLVDSDPVE